MLLQWQDLRVALAGAALLLAASFTTALAAEDDEEAPPKYPTTEFAEGATSASVSVGEVTAGIRQVRRPEVDPDFDVPLLEVIVAGKRMLEAPGVASGFDFPAAEASIAEMDPGNRQPEVYFSSFSGGAHCCSSVIVAEEVGDKWVAIPIGEFDGDGNYLDDLDGDGFAEIATVDNRFLYQFDCYACSAAPLMITTVRGGKTVDATRDPRFLAAHRDWLKQVEASVEPDKRWKSPGFLAGWVAEKTLVGEGAEAWKALNDNWDLTADDGEEVCLTGADLDSCPKSARATLKFPDRLKLFLEQSGYAP